MKRFEQIFLSLFKPATLLMGKISYLKKIVIISLLLLLPLVYTMNLLYQDFKEHTSRIEVSLVQLQKKYALYQMLLRVEDFHTNLTVYLQKKTSSQLKSQVKSSAEHLLKTDESLLVYLDENIKERCKSLDERLNRLLSADVYDRSVEKQIQEYKQYLYEQIQVQELEYLSPSSLALSNISYLMSFELPLATLLVTNINIEAEHNSLLVAIGRLQGSIEKTDLILQGSDKYESHFKELILRYKTASDHFGLYLMANDTGRSLHMKEAVLSLQLSLCTELNDLLTQTLEKHYTDVREDYNRLMLTLLLSVSMGIYLLIGVYASLRLSLRRFFDTTTQICDGKFDSRVSIDSRDEMGRLSSAFNKMIESLDYHYTLLNEYKRSVDISAIVVKTNLNGMTTYVNEAYENISGYSKEELIGSPYRLMQSKNTSHAQTSELWEYITNKKVYKTVNEYIAKNGKSFFVESTVVPILDRSGEISEFISIMFDITPLYKQQEKLQSQLYIDELTSIPNRLKLIKDIDITQAPKLVVINIDGFKEINAIYGESIGDLTLQKMTKEIRNALGNRHLKLYKLSADEFAILAGKEISIGDFREDVTMLSHYLNHIRLECGEHEISVRLTLGAAISELHHSQRPLISMADMALREAKQKMRPYLFYNDITSVDEDLEKNYKMIQMIEQAIKDDKVHCCYQGIINAQTGKIEKYEALMRIEDGQGKNIFPQNFVDIAKRTRFYTKLTKIVVQEAVYTFLHRSESISINLSVDDIMDDSTYEFILDVLGNCGCADRVVFEFLETEEIEFNDRVLAFTAKVKKMGAQIAIDDFGSGYSNYAYLMRLGVDILKIDASLIKDVDKNESSRLITQSIIDIAHALGMKTVAEHVHTKEVETIMKSMGADYLQGFYLHKPTSVLGPSA